MKENKPTQENKKEKKIDHTKINSFLYEQQRKEIDTLLEKKENKKQKKTKRRKITRPKRILLITVLYLLFAIPISYLLILQSPNQFQLMTWLVLGYFGVLILIYFVIEWTQLNHTKKAKTREK